MGRVIEFDKVSKLYRLGRVGTGTLSHDLNRWWRVNVLRQEDPYLTIGERNDCSQKGLSDYVWALKDVSFGLEQGEIVGIIGRNGAGKSTLLKLLSHITAPTTGRIAYSGRLSSLLEVGTGFNSEMTGRENVYMNGAILGMTRQEIRSRLDEIIDFSGVERYIDTPVKRYSSGMTVRLGFAVAAFLEPDILVVDEVLSVGDEEFQNKAMGKMRSVTERDGRTVIFVSHNLGAIKSICKRGIVLEQGKITFDGEVRAAIDHYRNYNVYERSANIVEGVKWTAPFMTVDNIELNGTTNNESLVTSDQETLDLLIEGTTTQPLPALDVRLEFRNKDGIALASLAEGHYKHLTYSFAPGKFRIFKRIRLPRFLAKGVYVMDIVLHQPNVCLYMQAFGCARLVVEGSSFKPADPLILDRDGVIGLESMS